MEPGSKLQAFAMEPVCDCEIASLNGLFSRSSAKQSRAMIFIVYYSCLQSELLIAPVDMRLYIFEPIGSLCAVVNATRLASTPGRCGCGRRLMILGSLRGWR